MGRGIGKQPLVTFVFPKTDLLPRQAVGEAEGREVDTTILLEVGEVATIGEDGEIPVEFGEVGGHRYSVGSTALICNR